MTLLYGSRTLRSILLSTPAIVQDFQHSDSDLSSAAVNTGIGSTSFPSPVIKVKMGQ